MLKERASSIANSISILKARRQALIREFISDTVPFLRSRQDIKISYGKALDELFLSIGREGEGIIDSVSCAAERDIGIDIIEKIIWGLKYKDILVSEEPVRSPDKRGYDFHATTPHLEESIYLFEKILESMLDIAAFESKLKRLGDEILKVTRRMKVLEERVFPKIKSHIKDIDQYIEERERESYCRLKRFKEITIAHHEA
jgi:V/A-type H+-transporting ATPase subunit D